MTIHRDGDKLSIKDNWYDHTGAQFQQLLEAFDHKFDGDMKHGCACNCTECQNKK